MQAHRKNIIVYDTELSTSAEEKRQELHHHLRSHTSKNENKNRTMIDVYQSLPVNRPFTAPTKRRYILLEATRKLQLVQAARRLFDANGHEIFRSEDIKRSRVYYVSCGEDYINPWKALKRM
ncbi:unnamed protein product [Rotaria sp. Silwood2]|nr:unnamed protein product [Rotaria sp. Silwood2]CAF2612580.1 unnamed protein product [Rotaria sp. Silwood2]CAF4111042.1 unnamed protein product [Rotaria sp. Silwood2]CAF4816469.1 unnamed protein product [Rotaria sp. Silwood2]